MLFGNMRQRFLFFLMFYYHINTSKMKLDAKIVVLSTYQYSQVLIAIVVSFVFHQPDRQHPVSETGSCLSHLQCGQGIRLVVLRYRCTESPLRICKAKKYEQNLLTKFSKQKFKKSEKI